MAIQAVLKKALDEKTTTSSAEDLLAMILPFQVYLITIAIVAVYSLSTLEDADWESAMAEEQNNCPKFESSKEIAWDKSAPCNGSSCMPLRPYNVTKYVYRGEKANPGEFPYMISLRDSTSKKSDHFCGGVLVDARWILTARHCTRVKGPIFAVSLLGANMRVTDPRHIQRVKRIIVAPRGRNSIDGDLALMELEREFQFDSRIVPINLPRGVPLRIGQRLTVIGSGSTEALTKESSWLLKAQIPIRHAYVCELRFNFEKMFFLSDSMICAGGQGSDACKGDSGGPLILKGSSPQNDVVVGIVSWGPLYCGTAPSGFIKIQKFLPWIERHLNGRSSY